MNNQLTTQNDQAVAKRSQVHAPRDTQEAQAVAMARAARERIIPKAFDKDGVYRDALENLRIAINKVWDSEAKFCDAVGLDKHYVSKCWPKHGEPFRREMGVGMYSRMCLALGLLDNCEVSDEQLLMRSSLREYLVVNNNALIRTTMAGRRHAQ
jgi:hypothetical protein